MRDVLDGCVLSQQQIETAIGDVADGAVAAGPNPDHRMRFAGRRRIHHDIVKGPIFSVVRKSFLRRPGFQQDFQGFLEARVGFGDRHVETDEFVVSVTFADPEIQPPAGQQIQRRGLFRQQNRIVPGQHHHRGAQAQDGGAGAD